MTRAPRWKERPSRKAVLAALAAQAPLDATPELRKPTRRKRLWDEGVEDIGGIAGTDGFKERDENGN